MVGSTDQRIYHALLEHVSDLVGILDPTGIFLYASPSFERVLGYCPHDLIGTNGLEHVHPDDLPSVRARLAEALATEGTPFTVTFRYRHANGLWRHIETTSTSRQSDPLIQGFVINGRDVTDRVIAAHALEADLAQLGAIVERLPVAVLMAEAPSGRIALRNAKADEIWGAALPSANEIAEYADQYGVRYPSGRLYRPEEYPLARTIAHGEIVTDEEIEFFHADGTPGTMSVSSSPIRDPDGNIVAGVLTMIDVTRARSLERTVRAHAERMATVLETMVDAVVLYDTEGRRVQENGAARRLFGFHDRAETHAQTVEERAVVLKIRDADDRPVPLSELPIMRALQGDVLMGENAVDLRLTGADGQEVEVNVTATPLRVNGQIVGAVAVYRDVTTRRRLERSAVAERDRLQAILEELRTLEQERESFLSSVSHDLKNPLATLRGMAQLIHRQVARGTFTPEKGLQNLESMIQITGSMTRMVEELVELSRRHAGRDMPLQRTCTDLVELTRSFVGRQEPLTSRRLVFETDLPSLVVSVDAPRIERVLSNLVSNALKYSPRRAQVTIRLCRQETADGAYAVLRVVDRGIGIPPEDQPRIFERFYRAANVDASVGGTGIGLASVLQFVEAHGGTIAAHSEVGRGSTFTVRLPIPG